MRTVARRNGSADTPARSHAGKTGPRPVAREPDEGRSIGPFAHPPLDFSRIPIFPPSPAGTRPDSLADIHAVQQYGSDASPPLHVLWRQPLQVSDPGDADEREADAAARQVMDGNAVSIGRTGGGVIHRQAMDGDEPVAEAASRQQNQGGSNVDPYQERRYTGAFHKLSEKFGSDFITLFVAGYLKTLVKSITPDAFGQMNLIDRIGEFDFSVLQNSIDDYPSTLQLQSVMAWRMNEKGTYVKNSWMKRTFESEPADKKSMVDNPGFRSTGEDSLDMVTDLGAANAKIRFIVRLMIVDTKLIT